MNNIGYHGDHDFMSPSGTSFVRYDITIRLGDKLYMITQST